MTLYQTLKPTFVLQAQLVAAMEDIILQYTYPRLDAEVSKHRNHLLKAPFCVHPGTGTRGLFTLYTSPFMKIC